MKINKLIILFFFTSVVSLFSQNKFDTLTVMQYNLMRYGPPTLGINCTPPDYITRANVLKTIVGFVLPDVLAVEEIQQGSSTFPQYLLANAMNQDGRTYYKRASFNSQSGNDGITDMLYYNSTILTLTGQFTIGCTPRDARVYKLRYQNPTNNEDTASLVFVVAHLKSSNSAADARERGVCAANIMDYMKNNFTSTGNYFLMGDFNLYTSTEPAWQNMTSSTLPSAIRMFDPINQIGSWSNNSSFKLHHTQSTRTASNAQCFSTGGMDDRFDFILATANLLPPENLNSKIKYIPASYKAIGNDGLRFNGAVYDPADPNGNGSVPAYIASALFDMSDHLPVTMKLQIFLVNSSITGSITGVTLQGGYVGTISGTTISFSIPEDIVISNLTATGSVSNLSTVSPSFQLAKDYSSPISYTVTAQNFNKSVYNVLINRTPSTLTGLSEKTINENKISYTNPIHSSELIFHFEFVKNLHLTILDVFGKTHIRTHVFNQSIVDLSNLCNGFYHLVFSDENGKIYSKKLVVEKE